MAYILGGRSLARLAGVHPDLQRAMKRAIEISDVDFTVLEGRRTIERQKNFASKDETERRLKMLEDANLAASSKSVGAGQLYAAAAVIVTTLAGIFAIIFAFK